MIPSNIDWKIPEFRQSKSPSPVPVPVAWLDKRHPYRRLMDDKPSNVRLDSYMFCTCSDDSVHEILKGIGKGYVPEDLNKGIRDLLHGVSLYEVVSLDDEEDTYALYKIHDLNEIGEEGKAFIEWCVDFLIYKKEEDLIKSLWSFILGFLHVDKGYDYWLMNMLDWYKIVHHGSSLRCAWFRDDTDNPYKNRVLSEERKQRIESWLESLS
jgi:hypothetical protein